MNLKVILQLASGLVALFRQLFSAVEREKAKREGSTEERERAQAELLERVKQAQQVDEQQAKLTGEQVREQLERDGDFRD